MLEFATSRNRVALQFILFFISCLVIFSSISAERVGKILYTGYADDFQDTSMVVPFDMVALSEIIYVDHPESLTVLVDTPSVFFIVDHSGSMFEYDYDSATSTLYPPADPLGYRFKVICDLIDTLSNKRKFPGIEVGVAVFGSCLYWDPSDGLTTTVEGEPGMGAFDEGGYIPFLKLDQDYNGKTGAEIIKEKLNTQIIQKTVYVNWAGPDTTINYEYVDLTAPTPFFWGYATNINIGFVALKKALRLSTYDPKNHYSIFFSDGENSMGSPTTYIEGVDVPTTFTIFFTETGQAPQSLVTMNGNIQSNGYSSSNPLSTLWPFEITTFDVLMTFLMDNVISIFEQTVTIVPQNIEINGISGNATWDGEKFILPDYVPLTGWTTDFTYDINYLTKYDSIGINGDTIPVEIENIIPLDFVVEIDPNMTDPPDSFEVVYWDRTLGLYYNGTEITSIDDKAMDELEIQFAFDPGDAKYSYTKVDVEITNTLGSTNDKETFTLTKQGSDNLYTGTFERVIDPDNVTVGDGILQHSGYDTFIAVFRNNEKTKLPLDTLQIKIPVNLVTELTVEEGIYFDNNADGFVDSLFIAISGGGVSANLDEIKEAIILPEFRNFTVKEYSAVSGGISFEVEEKALQPQTYVTAADDILVVTKKVALPNGNIFLLPAVAPINDSVAPIIMKASFYAAIVVTITGKDTTVSDDTENSLTVTFSEAVKSLTRESPFKYYCTEDKKKYDAKLSLLDHDKETGIFRVESCSGVKTIQDGDSIRINWTLKDNVYDGPGNNQENSKNIRRKISAKDTTIYEYKPAPFTLIGKSTLLDPDHPDGYEIKSDIANIPEIKAVLSDGAGNYKGIMIITLEPDVMENVTPHDSYEGILSIYDALGNVVLLNKKMGYHEKNKQLIYIWDGRNEAGRVVGASSYMAYIPVKYYFDEPDDGKPKEQVREEVKKIILCVKD